MIAGCVRATTAPVMRCPQPVIMAVMGFIDLR
jgi:hypothetical protein